ncbi:GNAT family N-acetyltransferase [Streptomyces celluloflavus]|uniref:GNAT family N-acetyltransferase n=1 Tax=Streptomyces celluloflavus TaxID=58344 RepID=UPI0036962865
MNAPAALPPPWTVSAEPFDSPEAWDLLREYYTEVADRYYELHEGRRSTAAEIEQGLAEYPSGHLAPPHGVLLVARYGGVAAGCAGVRLLDARTAELKQVFLRTARRGLGGAGGLLAAAETAAAGMGAERIRLDTRLDLVEAVALYRRHGYQEIAPYHDDPYSEIFFEKRIAPESGSERGTETSVRAGSRTGQGTPGGERRG